ncbi:MAG: bifunctional methylenetetrahydrofolate dehydrogenase/methenyltetrahydrofolate cyclohydrolase FolD [Salinisphaera sp.]|nr:bifunctional methylenetetrahydrofolate dehydrogenase/methenyltetrahydrofolate cyclohydrolase FolD [Salinisphaera sp.]
MTARLIDGKRIAAEHRAGLREQIAERSRQGLRPPGLAVILLGDDIASRIYVDKKIQACAQAGILSRHCFPAAAISEDELLATIDDYNRDEEIDGILVQLPLPGHIHAGTVIERIHPDKDVDGFHPWNVGRLAQRVPRMRACTPLGIIRLLEAIDEPFYGRRALVVGASNIVGRPMALELLLKGATVTVAHRFTRDLALEVGNAEILVVAVGHPGLVPGEWIRPGATVIDVGMNRTENGLVGDVGFAAACERAAWITPVPGGVGPMTVAMLMENTLASAELRDS